MTRKRSSGKKKRSSQELEAQVINTSQQDQSLPLSSIFQSISSPHMLLLFGAPFFFFLASMDYLWVTEDAFITMQSVENVWAGYGPVFNRGIRVESFSHPLWFVILCALRVFGQQMLPPLAAVLGVILSTAGLILAAEAARRRCPSGAPLFPFGALVIAALPAFWEFASSGLETGLTFFWIGLCSWCLVKISEDAKRWAYPACLIIGCAPLLRPDLLALSLPLLAAALIIGRGGSSSFHGLVKKLAFFVAPGAVWQVFRMGYYGALVPNTYIAKEGLSSRWDQGWAYLLDLMQPYWLLPILAVGVMLMVRSCDRPIQEAKFRSLIERDELISMYAMSAAAFLHGALVCRAGGDFMHARLLLPALFALASSFAVVPLFFSARLRYTIVGVFTLWAFFVVLSARSPYGFGIGPKGITDERHWYVTRAQSSRPCTLNDYYFLSFYRTGEEITKKVIQRKLKAVYWAHIGITSAMIPDNITVIDPLSLNDHIGSRTILKERGRPGHEKIVPASWFLARYPAGVGLVVTNQLDGVFEVREPPEKIEAARQVLQTAVMRELEEAVSAPMTMRIFFKNLMRSWRLTFLRIPADPVEALALLGPKD